MAGTVPLLLELDEDAPIKSLGLIHRIPGMARIHFDFAAFDRPKQSRQQIPLLGPPQQAALPGNKGPSKVVIALLEQHGGPMTRKQLAQAAGGGIAGQRIVANVASMVATGTLKKVAPATYDLAERKEPTPPATGADVILACFTPTKTRCTKDDFKEAFVRYKRSPGSIGDQVRKLIKAGALRRVARSNYERVYPENPATEE